MSRIGFDALVQNDDNIYYNAQVVKKQAYPVPFQYFDKRAFKLVDCGYDYKLAVVRFSVDTSEIPIMYFPSNEFSSFAENTTYTTPDNSYYSVTITDNLGVTYQSYLQFESFNDTDANDLRIWTIDQFLQS